jgi:hypothetical protein
MSDDSVIQFPGRRREPGIWACECGCTTHRHYETGAVECSSCGNIASGPTGGWRARLPEPPAEIDDLTGSNFAVIDIATAENYLRRKAKAASDVVAIVIVESDGGVSSWSTGDLATPDRRKWLRQKLVEAEARIIPNTPGA